MIAMIAPAGHIINYSKVQKGETPSASGKYSKRKLIYGNIGDPVKESADWTHVNEQNETKYIYTPNSNVAHRWSILNF